ncbi:predicted protein [Sclerotinia sclerotiorum 1980 UF-70]|uniref:Uncharacterized protein n=1 Tax=Sclerotinia sclerotiorum (strain ATCC 18683 / 1980 / Ss-1) TaxID=665079 RepID=A7F3E7_SCLS1|nr:predicted protein [Sclerotinia sclerotiorum 1980 UF-70]EDN97268.1 predicted protein [Sclerotinia sclerotiorum 1980 UF-70]
MCRIIACRILVEAFFMIMQDSVAEKTKSAVISSTNIRSRTLPLQEDRSGIRAWDNESTDGNVIKPLEVKIEGTKSTGIDEKK